MRALSLLLIPFLFSTACCSPPPDVALAKPWYEVNSDLVIKAKAHETRSMEMVDDSGLLLYRAWKPWGPKGDERVNFLDSHDVADAPAWQGMLMAGLAFAQAVDGQSRDDKLQKLAGGLLRYYSITGTPGLFGRSHLAGYKGPRLKWMTTKEQRPTKFWMQGKDGSWWRNGLAKNHLNMACFGCAIPLALSRRGEIKLAPETKKLLVAVLVPAVKHLIGGNFRIRDFDGRFTEYGDLRGGVAFGPNSPNLEGLSNPFNRLLVLHLLRSAAFYDEDVRALYELRAKNWAEGVGASMDILGEVIQNVCRSDFDKPSFSDMQAFGLAALSMELQETRRDILKPIHRGMKGLWAFMQFERNPCFALPFSMIRPKLVKTDDLIEDLRVFPMPDQKIAFLLGPGGKVDSYEVQPLCNRPTNANYWKSNPYRKIINRTAKPLTHPKTKAKRYFAGQDFLISYWLGRYLGKFPKQ